MIGMLDAWSSAARIEVSTELRTDDSISEMLTRAPEVDRPKKVEQNLSDHRNASNDEKQNPNRGVLPDENFQRGRSPFERPLEPTCHRSKTTETQNHADNVKVEEQFARKRKDLIE